MHKADLKKLEVELYRHGLAGFRRIREAHPKAKFYCFGFYTNGEFTYAALTASTYEGLDKVAHELTQTQSSDAAKNERRLWSIC